MDIEADERTSSGGESGGDGGGGGGGVSSDDDAQTTPLLHEVDLLVEPGLISAGGRNSYDASSGLHRLILGPSRRAFFAATGPTEVVVCNLQVSKIKHNEALVQKLPTLQSSSVTEASSSGNYAKNSDEDTYALTEKGRELLLTKGRTVAFYARKECSGAPARAAARLASVSKTAGRPNCERACGGFGSCLLGCPYLEPSQGEARSRKKPPASHDCSLVVTERATLEDINNGCVYVTISGGHVQPGKIWHPCLPQQLTVDRVALGRAATVAARAGQAGKVSANCAAQQKEQVGSAAKKVRVSRRADGGTGDESSSRIVTERTLTSSSIKWSPALLALAEACPSTGSRLQSSATTAPGLGSPEAFAHPALVPSDHFFFKTA